ncbi:hypothetical protein GLW04_19535 [Halobacillus litoralis]|uniref:Uncharacterized protein n=1 Tax=Halobacillus litoralis TaxID=45668 RepID=A0A845DWY9_9BACI|nr:hypothetical protein [Halobacillus litoralis]MYL22070.1 hypothetical protein [Halobacillus litoralis]MYL25157.1 hypothetical protein [Halomonas alkaliantarctica]
MMFSITGQLLKAFAERQVNKETGEEVTRHRIQLLGDVPLRDGSGSRHDLVTLNVESLNDYKELEGKTIRVPFGFFAPAKGNVITFVPKGSKPALAG